MNKAESELKYLVHHSERAIALINQVQREHLDYDAQKRRLKKVMSRFGPLMERIDLHLPSIKVGLEQEARTTAAVQKRRG